MVTEKKPKKPRRRGARGAGTIFFSDRLGKWVGRIVVGRTPAGKTMYIERSAATQRELVRKLAEAKPPGADTTVAVWAARWLGGLSVRDSTRDNYQHSVEAFIVPALGSVRLDALTAGHVEHAVKGWMNAGLKPTTARLHLAHLGACLGAAVRSGLILINAASRAKKPKVARAEIDPFTTVQLQLIMSTAAPIPSAGAVALLAAVGCRVGEAMALDVQDFDPKTGKLSITKTWSRKYGVGPPKSPYSVRTIRVPAAVVSVVESAIGGRTAGPLFTTEKGNRRPHELVRQAWIRVCRDAGLPFRNIHQLRHSVATGLISVGVPLGDAAVYLGDRVETVVKTYLHPAGTDPADALDRLYG